MQERGIHPKNIIHCTNQKHSWQDLSYISFEKRWLQISMSEFHETKTRENNEETGWNLTHFHFKITHFQILLMYFHVPMSWLAVLKCWTHHTALMHYVEFKPDANSMSQCVLWKLFPNYSSSMRKRSPLNSEHKEYCEIQEFHPLQITL